MAYYYLGEKASIDYSVTVKPPPADTATATLRKGNPGGAVDSTQPLNKQGKGKLDLDTNKWKLEDSPIFIEFAFAKKGVLDSKALRAIALADPVPAKLEPANALVGKIGEKVEVKVAAWAALVYDAPGQATETPESDATRIPDAKKKEVKWRLDGEDLSQKGEKISIEIKKEHNGKALELEAYLGTEPPGRARARIDVKVLRVQLHDETYKPCAGIDYELTLADGKVLKGKTDGSGWLEQPLPPPQECRVSFLPKGETVRSELRLRVSHAAGDADEWYVTHLKNMGFDYDGEPLAASLVRFQAARGLDLTGELDEATKDAILMIVADESDSMRKTLFEGNKVTA